MSDVVDVHPRWCSPRQCKALGMEREHRSEPRGFDLRRVSSDNGPVSRSGTGTAWLTQAAMPWRTETFVHAEGGSFHLYAPLSQAAGFLAQLTELVEEGGRQ